MLDVLHINETISKNGFFIFSSFAFMLTMGQSNWERSYVC